MMYLDKLAKAQEYVEQIKETLKKLNADPVEELGAKQQKKRGPKPQVKTIEKPEPKKPGRKQKVVLPDIESKPAVLQVTKEVEKKVEPKKLITPTAPVVVEKSVIKAAAEKKLQTKSPATVESAVTSLLTPLPEKVVKPVAKKKTTEQQRIQEMAKSARLSKPVTKKAQKVKPVVESAPIEPNIIPTE